MIISFAGHSFVPYGNTVKEIVKTQIRNNVTSNEPIICYLGGCGDFDSICACACRELKHKYPRVSLYNTVSQFIGAGKNQRNAKERIVRYVNISAD